MADSLDDFFAKKDKKRGKEKNKAAFSAVALVKELEEGSRQAEFPVRKDTKTSTAIELLGLDADDADWRDFEDIEKRDYSGLKVKEMSLQDQNEEEQRRLVAEQSELVPESTPWKIKEEVPAATAPAPAADGTANAKQEANAKASESAASDSQGASRTAPSTENQSEVEGKKSNDSSEKKSDTEKKKYVPPPQKNAERGEFRVLEPTRLSKLKTSSSRQGAELDLSNQSHFPSLG